MRDRIMRGVGTDEPWVVEEMTAEWGERAVSVHYRRPLRKRWNHAVDLFGERRYSGGVFPRE